MPDYSNGKIYTIRNRNDNTKIYVGSTIQPLYKRLYTHKCSSKKEEYMNRLLYIEINGDWTNWYIELYEHYPCNNRNELEKREGEIIRLIGTLNKSIAGRDDKQYRIDKADKIKQYYIDNADKVKEKNKQYRTENAENIKEYMKTYYSKNADEMKEKAKQYSIENPDRIKEKSKQYYLKNADKIKEKSKQYHLKKKEEKLKEISETTA